MLSMRRREAVALLRLYTALLSDDASAAASSSCSKSGLSPAPQNTTLAVDKSDPKVAVVVTSACEEASIALGGTQFETSLTVANLGIVRVVSYPVVDTVDLSGNQIEAFSTAGDNALLELDVNNNHIASLDALQLPSSLQTLTTRTEQFPSGLKTLIMSKNGIDSLESLDFPAKLTSLTLDGNALTTLKGAVLPATLETLSCMNCGTTTIEGVRFPSTLQKLLLGSTVTEFIVRASDVAVLSSTTQANVVVNVSSDCANGGVYTQIKGSISACVMQDAEFNAKYPERAAVTKAPSSSSSSLAGGSTPGVEGSTTRTNAPNASSDTSQAASSSNSSTYLIIGLICGAIVLVGAIIGLVLRRRKRNSKPMRVSELRDLLNEVVGSGKYVHSGAMTLGGDLSEPLPTSNVSGYFTNDVRNDEELLPYRLPKDEVKIVREIAVGGFGIVYMATFHDQTVVVKQIARTQMSSKAVLSRFMDEIRLYARLEHPKIARFIGLSWTTLFDLSLVMEYVPNGDLSTLLKQNREMANGREVFTWFSEHAQPRCKTLIALDLAEALVYLHSFDPLIIHRDLKSKNVLMAEDWTAKLTDFGISRAASEETMTGGMGTTAWIAPEVLQGERYSEKADIYSFGVVLSELDTCGHPYNSNRAENDTLTDPKIAVLVSTDALKPTIEDDCPPAIRKLILSCVAFNPSERPNAMDLHFRLRSIRNEAIAGGFA
ncbi:Tkl protein kinase [Globisporangium polare]